MSLAGVEFEKVVVSPGEDIVEIIAAKENLKRDFDGILTAGGDGTNAAIFNGLVVKALRDAGDEGSLDVEGQMLASKKSTVFKTVEFCTLGISFWRKTQVFCRDCS